jgi:hypothetical protein
VSNRARIGLVRWVRRTADATPARDPLTRRAEPLLHDRLAAVRADLLTVADLLERAQDPEPACVDELRGLLSDGTGSPLLNQLVHVSELYATLFHLQCRFERSIAGEQDDDAAGRDGRIAPTNERWATAAEGRIMTPNAEPRASTTLRRLRAKRLAAVTFAMISLTLVLAIGPSLARADSLAFTKPDGNIYLSNPDGSGQYQVTLDGTPSDPYFSPSETAGGVIEAGHGTGSTGQIVQLTQNGTALNHYTSAAPGGPVDPVVSPDGKLVTYYAFTAVDNCYPWICPGGATAQLVGAADHFVDPSTYINEGTGFNHGVWVSDTRLLLFHHNGTIWFYDIGAAEPFQWGGLFSGLNPNLDWFFEGAASSDDTRLAVITGSDGFSTSPTAYIQLFGTAGDLATAADPTLPTYGCTITPPDGSTGYQGNPITQEYLFSNVTWSPDGRSLAFDYNGAIYVAHIPDVSDCSTITVSQVIASGSSPFWSAASIDPAPRPSPQPTPGPTPKVVARVGFPRRGKLLRVSGRNALVALTCTTGQGACDGAVAIQSAGAHSTSAKSRVTTYAVGAYSLGAGEAHTFRLRLSRTGRSLARRHRTMTVWINVSMAGSSVALSERLRVQF